MTSSRDLQATMNRGTARNISPPSIEATGWELILSIVLAALCSLTEGIGIVLLIPTLQISGLNLMGQGRVQSMRP